MNTRTLGWNVIAFSLIVRAALALEPIPDKTVILTFDDSVASQYTVVRPILKQYGFGATFFITEGFSFPTNKTDYMTWEQIRELNQDGFEIGNHTRDHMGVSARNAGQLREQVEAINARCAQYGIPRPASFGYPGNSIEPTILSLLHELKFQFARRGGAPENPYEWGRGLAYEPGKDHPLLIPSAGDARPDWTLADFKRAADQARDGKIAVIQFHGVPDREHQWVNTPRELFEEYMRYLKANGFHVIALRDLARYVDVNAFPENPMQIIEKRQAEHREVLVEGDILDDATGRRLPARIYIMDHSGAWHFPKSAFANGSAIRYERRNGSNTNAVEMHTTLSADPFRIELLPGTYLITIEHGKEFFPEMRVVEVQKGMAKLTFRLRRWINMNEQGWYSGDTHNHRNPVELPNVMLAEDLNIGLPMVDWTTTSTIAPTASTQGFRGDFGDGPIRLDATHAWTPRSTEYEIFRTGNSNHMLGALLIVNHKTRFSEPVIPLRAVAEHARKEGALLDLEKHNWPWSIALVPAVNVDLFELANNHHWETEYAVRNWAIPGGKWMGLGGSGTDNELDWTLYGFQTYYALLNCGFNLRPAAGTANGVHPVPLGFSRVYVHLDEPFSFDAWMRGLSAGRSFVTTGPMILARADGQWPGQTFKEQKSYTLDCAITSEQPLESIELIVNGEVWQRTEPQNTKMASGAFENKAIAQFAPSATSWVAWRCFEKRPKGRFRFAHTAPWHFEIAGAPLRPRRAEIDWLVGRVKEEIARSRDVAPQSLIDEYQHSLEAYEQIAKTAR